MLFLIRNESMANPFKDFGCAMFGFFKKLPTWAARDFKWPLLAVPLIVCFILYFLFAGNAFGWLDEDKCKHDLEIVHPAVLAAVILTAGAGWFVRRDGAVLFIGILGALAFSRELMGQGSSFVFILGVICLIFYGMKKPEKISGFVSSKWSQSLLGSCFLCYLVSQLLDRGVIKRIGWVVFMDKSWEVPFSSNFEECLEALGGIFLLACVLSLFRKTGQRILLQFDSHSRVVSE